MVYESSPDELIAVGALGVVFYVIVLVCSCVSIGLSVSQSLSTKLFFSCLALMSIFELPWYVFLCIDARYTFQAGYSLHYVAGMFFFCSYSVVCFQWCSVLEVGTYFSFLYSKYGLIASNVLFDIIDIIAFCWCASESSLKDYFKSTEYLAFNTIEGLKNIVYFGVLFYHGVLLLRKLWNHSYEERMRGSSVNKVVHNYFDGFKMISGSNYEEFEATAPNDEDPAVFLPVVVRLTIALFLCFLCFSLRVAMMIVKIVYYRNPRGISTKSFTHNGVAWYFGSEFIPRVIPSLAFMYLMRKKKKQQHQDDQLPSALELESSRDLEPADMHSPIITVEDKSVRSMSSSTNDAVETISELQKLDSTTTAPVR